MTSKAEFLIEIESLHFGWNKESDFLIIDRFEMQHGEHVFLEGPSGTGKSTLLGLIAGVLSPRSGRVCVAGKSLPDMSSGQKDRLRADHLGVIFQLFNLLPYLSMTDNVLLPCRFSATRRDKAIARSGTLEAEARRLLTRLGLPETLHSRTVGNLSVGQQQRVAAARAFIGAPDLIIADEPTSAMDTGTRDAFLALLMEQAGATDAGLLFVSHDRSLAPAFGRQLSLSALNTAHPETV